MEKFTIQSLPEIIVASHREVIQSYDELSTICIEKIAPEMLRLGCKCSPTGYCFSIEYPPELRADGIDLEYCEQVEKAVEVSDIIKFRTFPAVQRALCVQHIGTYDTLPKSYTEAFRHIEQLGLKVAGNPRTVYVDGAWNQPDPTKWLSIIQIPIE